VADERNDRILKLSADGEPLAVWGEQGSDPGQFDGPSGQVVDLQGNVYVADSGRRRVLKLSGTGELLAQWGV
jgi:DNA-binding beta-propeller fold protein YncE